MMEEYVEGLGNVQLDIFATTGESIVILCTPAKQPGSSLEHNRQSHRMEV
jgi:hypothetical protein